MPDPEDTTVAAAFPEPEFKNNRLVAPDVTRRGALIAALTGVVTLSIGTTVLRAAPAQANASWDGYQNGRIPLSALSMVGGYYFRKDAAAALDALRNEYRSARGKTLIINDGYRDYAGQEQALREYGRPRAAVPGQSNHGWALAVDFGGTIYSGPNNDDHRWLQANAGRFGWWWAGQYFDYFEPWHWEYNGAYNSPTQEEDDMFSDQDRALLQSVRDAMKLEARSWYKIIHTVNDNNIWVVGVTGKRVRVQQPYHVELLRRFRDEDTLDTAELDLLKTTYLEPIA